MASPMCWRCLSMAYRPQAYTFQSCLRRRPVPTLQFSTTAVLPAQAPRKKPGVAFGGPPKRGDRALKLGKNKKNILKARPPGPGERKAIKKRIILSNTNAFEVEGLKDLSPTNFADHELRGKMVGLPGPIVDALRIVNAFKPTQGWGFFRRPAVLMRKEFTELAEAIEHVGTNGQNETLRKIIIGQRGSGKSVLLLYVQAMAFAKGWVVIHIPEAQDLTIAHTEYAPASDIFPVQYIQKTYTANLLSQISKANLDVLSSLQARLNHNLPVPVQENISLARLANLGARDPDIAWPIFQALWSELTAIAIPEASPDANKILSKRPPILLSLDGIAHVSRLSEYLAPSMHYIHAHDLVLVDHFMSYLSGARTLPNGGMVLATDSNANRPSSPALDLAIRQNTARMAASSTSTVSNLPLYDPNNPYGQIDARVLKSLQNVDLIRLDGLSKGEAKTLLEYYAASGMLSQIVTEGFVSEKLTLSGGGNARELEKTALRSSA